MYKPLEIRADKESSTGLNPDVTGRSNHNKVLEAGLNYLPVQGTGVAFPRCGISESHVPLYGSSARPYFRGQLSAWQPTHLNPEGKQNSVGGGNFNSPPPPLGLKVWVNDHISVNIQHHSGDNAGRKQKDAEKREGVEEEPVGKSKGTEPTI